MNRQDITWYIVESGVKHHNNFKPKLFPMDAAIGFNAGFKYIKV
jgi:hypothetical protein